MKHLFLIVFTTILLVSCEKSNEINASVLVGKWQLDKYEMETIHADGTTNKSTAQITEKTYWEFKKDGSVRCTDKKGSITEYTYSFDEGNMILTIGVDKHNVKELTKNSLIIVSTGHFIDGSVKPAGIGTTNHYNYWIKTK